MHRFVVWFGSWPLGHKPWRRCLPDKNCSHARIHAQRDYSSRKTTTTCVSSVCRSNNGRMHYCTPLSVRTPRKCSTHCKCKCETLKTRWDTFCDAFPSFAHSAAAICSIIIEDTFPSFLIAHPQISDLITVHLELSACMTSTLVTLLHCMWSCNLVQIQG